MTPGEMLSPDSLALGVTPGTVIDIEDPGGLGRIRVEFSLRGSRIESDWLQIMSINAGPNYGAFFPPAKGDTALLAFANGDASRAYVLGFLWNGAQKPPVEQAKQQDVRVIQTRSGKTIMFDDSQEGKGGIVIVDNNKNRIEVDTTNNKIMLSAEGDLDISAKGNVTIRGAQVTVQNTSGSVKATLTSGAMQLQGDQNMTLSAKMIDLN